MLTATDDLTQLDISELVDMEKEPGCEHSGHHNGDRRHSGPAYYIVRVIHPCFGGKPILLCKTGFEQTHYFWCRYCKEHGMTREEVWQLVSVL
jgi:hypothetical protein